MDNALLEILVCPNCKGRLRYDRANEELVCRFDHIAYPIKDGVPVLLIDSARKLKDGEK